MNQLAALQRLFGNMIRLGTVAEVDHAAARCRVQSGDIRTAPLPWLSLRAGSAVAIWSPPAIGEQVVMLSPGGDLCAAIVLTGIYSTAVPAPSDVPTLHTAHYADGAVIEYDHATHRLVATLPSGGSATLTADGGVTINGPLTVNGNTQINGDAAISGTAEAQTDVIGGGISLIGHKHSGVQAGSALTGAPQ